MGCGISNLALESEYFYSKQNHLKYNKNIIYKKKIIYSNNYKIRKIINKNGETREYITKLN